MMNKFIKRCLLFLSFLLLYLGFNYAINSYLFSNSKIPLKDARVYIMGDSHTRRALNPKLFSSAVNISQQSEPYIITYWKLKKIIDHKKIDTLLLAFAPHNISAFNDRKLNDEKWASEMFERTYLINNFKEIPNDIKVNRDEFYKTYFFKMLVYPNFNHFTFIGNYKNDNSSNPSDYNKVINRHFYFNDKEIGVSETSILFLNKIIRLCHEQNIVPILISTPVHSKYYEKIPSPILEKFQNIEAVFLKKKIKIVNSLTKKYEDKLFFNADHLNHHGAKLFTKYLIQSLKP